MAVAAQSSSIHVGAQEHFFKGCRVKGFRFRVCGLGFRVEGVFSSGHVGFRVQGAFDSLKFSDGGLCAGLAGVKLGLV